VEEGWIDGGLGAPVASIVAERHPVPVLHMGLEGGYDGGGPAGLLRQGLTAAHIMGAVHDVMELKA